MNLFLKGTILLVIAAFIGECLEFIINIVLARELGEEGLGLYMAIFPTIVFLVVIASMELPISVSKAIAEKDQKYHRTILQHGLRFTAVFAVAFFLVALILLPLIPIFDKYHPLLRWFLLILIPIISLSSIARGYFMGAHKMGKIALANFLRRAVQLILLITVFHFFQFDSGLAIMIALCTLIGTELVVFLYLISNFILEMRRMKKRPSEPIAGLSVLRTLLSVSLPTTGLRIFYAASFAIKPFLIKIALVRSGVVEEMAMIQYGKLAGVAFAIGFFPAFIAHSLMIILIPTVSELYAKKDMVKLKSLLKKVMLLTLSYSIPAVSVFYLFSGQLTSLFFEASVAAIYLKLLVPYFFFHFFVIPMQAFLIGFGLVKDAFLHSVWTTTISFLLMFTLGSMPMFQMGGIIIGMNTGVVLLTFMHFLTIKYKFSSY